MSLRSVTSSARRQQEAEVTAAQERERAEATVRAARLAAVELAAARAEVEAAEAADAARTAAAELEALRDSRADSSASIDDNTDEEFRLAREAAREQAVQWAVVHPHGGARGGSPDGRRHDSGAPGGGDRVDGDHGLYRRHGSPSKDQYHGRHGAQAIVRDIGPGGG
jgi:membrane protein involved in colicin uptake